MYLGRCTLRRPHQEVVAVGSLLPNRHLVPGGGRPSLLLLCCQIISLAIHWGASGSGMMIEKKISFFDPPRPCVEEPATEVDHPDAYRRWELVLMTLSKWWTLTNQ